MCFLRDSFKIQAEHNKERLNNFLKDHIQNAWLMLAKCNDIVGHRLAVVQERRVLDSIIILHGIISDLCCVMDGLERGYTRTIQTNIRSSIEDYWLAEHLHRKKSAHEKFLKGEQKATNSKQNIKNPDRRGFLNQSYTHFTKKAHLSNILGSIRNLTIKEGVERYHILKLITPEDLTLQLTILIEIQSLSIFIAELAEEMCFNEIEQLYFLKKDHLEDIVQNPEVAERKYLSLLLEFVEKYAKNKKSQIK